MPATLRDMTSGEIHSLEDFTLIGRGEGATLRLNEASISRQHATIRRENHDYWLVDLGSANGSFVNDVTLSAARVLRNGDRVRLGNADFLFQQNTTVVSAVVDNMRTQISIQATKPMSAQQVTLFVADLKGFTRMSERLPAEQVAELLREWYADCQRILRHYGASIDKFIGDSVFAYWHGVDFDTRRKALHAAQELRAADHTPTTPVRLQLKAAHGMELDCRIGIHVGAVAMGPMGQGISTALGDAVNLAFRIEGLTRVTEQPLLVSGAFVEGWSQGRPDFRSCGIHQVKGRVEPVEVFALAGAI